MKTNLISGDSQVSFDEGHLDESGNVDGGFVEACEHATGFFQPTDQAFDDVPLSIDIAIKVDWPIVAILVHLGGNHRYDPQFEQMLIDPVSSVSLVPSQLNGPSDRFGLVLPQQGFGALSHDDQ